MIGSMQTSMNAAHGGPRNHIVIVDCDHNSIDQEQEVAAAAGIPVTRAFCRSEEDVIEAAASASGIIVQYAPITRRVIESLPKLRVIGRYGVGVDTVDVEAATEHGVAVCNVPDYGTEDVSDHAIALITDACRSVSTYDRAIREGNYSYDAGAPLHRFSALQVGVVGAGLIGRATARKARGLGYSVVASDPTFNVGDVVDGIPIVSLDELLGTSDVVSLHVPLNPATEHLINGAALAKMKSEAVLVNTCRGGVVATADLVEALERRDIRGAALDVFEEEPIGPEHPLAKSAHTVLTPHVAWYSEESFIELKTRITQNVVSALNGEHVNVVNGWSLTHERLATSA
ncbi:C-terminal binding protein [Paenarthrobacter sp. NPDC089675]|uniref:C-terminal binding protein n=1 Tax=Paenarthrobacter TaxID=1742992 RepID=UPI0038012A0B